MEWSGWRKAFQVRKQQGEETPPGLRVSMAGGKTRRGSGLRPPGKEGFHLLLPKVWPNPSGSWPLHSDTTSSRENGTGVGEGQQPFLLLVSETLDQSHSQSWVPHPMGRTHSWRVA